MRRRLRWRESNFSDEGTYRVGRAGEVHVIPVALSSKLLNPSLPSLPVIDSAANAFTAACLTDLVIPVGVIGF